MKHLHLTILFSFIFPLTFLANDIVDDVNADGKVGMDNAHLLVNYLLDISGSIDTLAADINNDGKITMADANAIVNMVVQKTTRRDTITILYVKDSDPDIYNPAPSYVHIDNSGSNSNDVTVLIKDTATTAKPFVSVKDECTDGRLRVISDIDYTLILNGVNLTSSHAPAFNSTAKGKVYVTLADGTENRFADSKKYVFSDTLETGNGCFSCYGPVSISGTGAMTLQGKYSHALYCKKSITVNGGSITVNGTKSDALHSGKNVTVNGGQLTLKGMKSDAIDLDDDFTMTGGAIEMDITGEAAKGIKCGGIMNIRNGSITATASGALKNSKGDLSYCTILKCDSNAIISGGEFDLVNNTPGGKCISVGRNLTIIGGTMNLETHGDGAEYTNADGETDYYTSKCIAADDSLFIHRGNIQCLSTGIGGKGIVGNRYMVIGMPTDTQIEQGPIINVETTNCSIVNDVEEDQRYGCPKAIKSDENLYIYSGNIHCVTAGMGGEGVECGKDFYFHNGNLECNCFDDGINVGEKIEILGGQIYCNSEDNDGIDSNGSIYLKGGIVVAINHNWPNESIDAEGGNIYLEGASVFGMGKSGVKIAKSDYPYYNTDRQNSLFEQIETDYSFAKDKYIYIIHADEILFAIKVKKNIENVFLTVTLPSFIEERYSIFEGNVPLVPTKVLFENKVMVGGFPNNIDLISNFYPTLNIKDL